MMKKEFRLFWLIPLLEGDTIHTGVVKNWTPFDSSGTRWCHFLFLCVWNSRLEGKAAIRNAAPRNHHSFWNYQNDYSLSPPPFVKARKNMKNDETFRPPSWERWRLVCLVQLPTKNHGAYSSASSKAKLNTDVPHQKLMETRTCSLSTLYNSHERTKKQQLDLVLWFLFSQRVWHETSRIMRRSFSLSLCMSDVLPMAGFFFSSHFYNSPPVCITLTKEKCGVVMQKKKKVWIYVK